VEREIPVGSGPLWEQALSVWDQRLDPAQAQLAAQRFEGIAKREPKSPDAWAWCARSRYDLGDYEPDEGKRRGHFEEGMKLGRRGIDLDGKHVPALFWTSVCEASYVELIGMLRRATYLPEILGFMKQVWQIDPGYYHHGAARLLGQALVRQPGLVRRFLPLAMPEMGPDVVIREMRQAIADGPPIVLTHQTLAQVLHATKGDRAIVREQLKAIMSLDLDADSNFAPENRRDQPRAAKLLKALA
jgi:hypothetical protein